MLARLSELPRWDARVGEHTWLTGRSLQPWRALLAVVARLDSLKEPGGESLFARLESPSLGPGRFSQIRNNRANLLQEIHSWDITTEQVVETPREAIQQ